MPPLKHPGRPPTPSKAGCDGELVLAVEPSSPTTIVDGTVWVQGPERWAEAAAVSQGNVHPCLWLWGQCVARLSFAVLKSQPQAKG